MIRVVLAGGAEETRTRLADLLAERLGMHVDVRATPPVDLDKLDAELARQGESLDALLHLGGAAESLLDRYGRAVVEVRSTEVDDLLAALREALVAG